MPILTNNSNRRGPYLVVAPIMMIILGFYGKMLPGSGPLVIGGCAAAGLLWALLTGLAAGAVTRRWHSTVRANTPLFLAIIAIGLMTGAGLMYTWMMRAALDEPSTTSATLSALMWPAVPFYIALNSAMELVLLALLVFWNWDTDRRRRILIVASMVVYFVMRVWTYLVFAETRLDIVSHPLSVADIEWFRQTLAGDFRTVLNIAVFILLVAAACIPPSPWPKRNPPQPCPIALLGRCHVVCLGLLNDSVSSPASAPQVAAFALALMMRRRSRLSLDQTFWRS